MSNAFDGFIDDSTAVAFDCVGMKETITIHPKDDADRAIEAIVDPLEAGARIAGGGRTTEAQTRIIAHKDEFESAGGKKGIYLTARNSKLKVDSITNTSGDYYLITCKGIGVNIL